MIESKCWTSILVTSKKIKLEEDPDSKDLVLPIPTELLNQMGWDIGDDLVWSDNFDGSFSVIKKVDKSNKKAYNNYNDNSN
jgi:hypothetical protein